MEEKKKIGFVIGKLSSGGAERVISTLANLLIEKYHVTIITITNEIPFYPLDARINVISCFDKNAIRGSRTIWDAIVLNIKIVRAVYLKIRKLKIQLTIGFITQTNIYALVASRLNGNPCIISERTNPKFTSIPRLWRVLKKLCYPLANHLVVQTHFVKDYYSATLNMDKISVLPNPLSPNFQYDSGTGNRENIILNVGRLHQVKNQAMLLNVFHEINTNGWKLQILGEGNERENLEALILDKNIRNVELLGSKKNLEDYYKKAKIFVFTSNYEGFPNALLEAMRFGLAPISTNCLSGPSELIVDQKNGYLTPVKDLEALKNKLAFLVDNEDLIEDFGRKAKLSTKKFEAQEVVRLWENLILQYLPN